MLIGGHVSIAGGISKAVERAAERGFNVIQMFASSPRSYKVNAYPDKEIDRFRTLYREHGMRGLFFHAIYLLNLASSNPDLVGLSVDSLVGYMQFGTVLGAIGTIFHIGSSRERDFDGVKDQVVDKMTEILQKTPEDQFLIMENAAGSGRIVGDTLAELVYIFKRLNSPRVKVCLDTQHLFATGIDLRRQDACHDWLKEFDQKIGLDNLACVHTNDSKAPLGSKKDRHENIGQGEIGSTGLKNFLSHPFMKDKPLILETPGFDDQGPDRKNADILRRLF